MTPTEKPRQRFIPLEDDRLEYRHHVSIVPQTEANHRAAVEELFAEEQREQQRQAHARKMQNQQGRLPTRWKKRK